MILSAFFSPGFQSGFNRHFYDAMPWMFAVGAVFTATILYHRHKYGPKFPDRKAVKIVFEENFASGCSMRNLMTMFGGASRCLTITVTDSELWVRSFFPFGMFGHFYDLEHRIPLEKITSIEPAQRNVVVRFRRQRGSAKGHLVLRVRNPAALIQAVKDGQARDGRGDSGGGGASAGGGGNGIYTSAG